MSAEVISSHSGLCLLLYSQRKVEGKHLTLPTLQFNYQEVYITIGDVQKTLAEQSSNHGIYASLPISELPQKLEC